MSRRTNRSERRKLGLKKETLHRLSLDQLARVAGGTSWDCESCPCLETNDCDPGGWMGTGTRYC